MTFLWPIALAALALIPLLILLFVWRQRRRRRFAVRYSSLSLVRAALPAQSRLRRFLPVALFLLALASLAVGLARPVMATQVPAGRATVMLVLDVSGSMNQTDVAPSRLAAAKRAALEFVDKQRSTNQVGIVGFATYAQLVQAPTTDAEMLERAVLSLTTGRGTALGSGILAGLDAIDQYTQDIDIADPATPAATPRPDGEYAPDIIVLLSDGVTTTGPDPLESAQQAVDRKVRIYTIGYGTDVGSAPSPGGFRWRWGIDEEALEEIASMTGGKYYTARSASELQQVFDNLPTVLLTREETVEISVIAVALAALLVTSAVLLSQLWHPLP